MRISVPFCKRPGSSSFFRSAVAVAGLFFITASDAALTAQDPVDAILKIERGGQGVVEATAAAEQLAKQGVELDVLLSKASAANPVSKNWILSIAQSIADRRPAAARQSLERLLGDQQADGELRYWALDRLSERRSEVREKLLDGRTDDSSLDIRYEAIELAIKKLPAIEAAKENDSIKRQLVASYELLLDSARLPDQIFSINAKLKELESEVDLRKHFGFISSWHVIGPFDNRNQAGFDVVYPPEAEYVQMAKVDVMSRYPGKAGEVTWQSAATDKPDGLVNLNPILSNEKGAAAYAYAVVKSAVEGPCQVRFGTANANKVWVNGQESTTNNVYHTGSPIDQYIGSAKLSRGLNTVLVKVCQNEQTEEWAQDFAFKLRFSDTTGRAIELTQ